MGPEKKKKRDGRYGKKHQSSREVGTKDPPFPPGTTGELSGKVGPRIRLTTQEALVQKILTLIHKGGGAGTFYLGKNIFFMGRAQRLERGRKRQGGNVQRLDERGA